MAVVVIRHDLTLSPALDGERDDLTVVTTDTRDETLSALEGAEMLVTSNGTWDDAYLDVLDDGDWVQSTSTGYDNYPLGEFRDRGVSFTNAEGNYAPVIGEHVFAFAFAFSRRIPEFRDRQRQKVWDRTIGLELDDWNDRTMTVIGLGTIGEEIARRGQALNLNVTGVKRHPDDYDGCLPSERVIGPDEFPDVLPETELLVAIVPLTDETHHMIDADVFDALPTSAIFINVARGAVVDESALTDALERGEIAGAGLDVYEEEPLPEDSPLWDRDDVIMTPHIGGRAKRFDRRFADLFLENYDHRKAGEPLVNQIT